MCYVLCVLCCDCLFCLCLFVAFVCSGLVFDLMCVVVVCVVRV